MFTKSSLAVTIILGNFYLAKSGIISKVVGGRPVDIHHYPHTACINIIKHDGSYVCGASILNQRILLTAGHCITTPTQESFVYTGHYQMLNGEKYTIAAVKPHENYRDTSLGYDIGLILVETPIRFNNVVRRIALARRHTRKGIAAIAGWGLISEEPEEDTDILHHVELKVWSHETCRRYIRDLPKDDFCAGSINGSEYAAFGDSGCALVVKDYIQIGIVAFKMNTKDSLVAFTDVSYYYKWIKRNSKKLYCKQG